MEIKGAMPIIDTDVRHWLKHPVRIIIILAMLIIFFGCKSHKKVNNNVEVIVVETVENKKDEKKELNKKGKGEEIAEEALSWLGTPYKYGGQEKGIGTDCSGMVMIIYLKIAGKKLPRVSTEQGDFCEELKKKNVVAGDLVFFATGKDENLISHVGIMIDGERFVHASASKGVIISEITTPYYSRTFKKYGRVPE